MPLIEGVGDEVLACLGVSLLVALATFAWYTTRVRPLLNGGAVYVVQIEESSANRRVLQVLSVDEQALHDENVDLNQLLSSTPDRGQSPAVQVAADNPAGVSVDQNIVDSSANADRGSVEISNDVVPNDVIRNDVIKDDVGGVLINPASRISDGPPNDAAAENSQRKTIRLKFLDDSQKIASAWLSETVGDFIRKNFRDETSRGQTIRLIYGGQLLRDDDKTLGSYGVHDNCVVHCHVTSATPPLPSRDGGGFAGRTPAPTTAVGGLRPGRFVYAAFGLNFGLLWLLCVYFWQNVSVTALSYLTLCTAAYFTFAYHRAMTGRGASRRV